MTKQCFSVELKAVGLGKKGRQMEINLLSGNSCPSGHLFFTISAIIHCEGELNTVALLGRLCVRICSCVVSLLLCLDWESKTWQCYSSSKGVHFSETALLKPKTSSAGRSVKQPRAGRHCCWCCTDTESAAPRTESPE